jgi:hypothetical protein
VRVILAAANEPLNHRQMARTNSKLNFEVAEFAKIQPVVVVSEFLRIQLPVFGTGSIHLTPTDLACAADENCEFGE